MTTLLHLDASARTTRSISRELSGLFVREWRKRRPHDAIIRRDVGLDPPPVVTADWIAAVFTPAGDRSAEQDALLSVSDQLIDELARADLLLIGTPMYNYGMPSSLKLWFDQVIRIDKTFSFDLARGDWPLMPVMSGKTLVLLSSRGEFGFQPGGVREHMNFLDGHVFEAARYLGVEERHLVATEYQEFGDERHAASKAKALARIPKLVEELAAQVGAAAA